MHPETYLQAADAPIKGTINVRLWEGDRCYQGHNGTHRCYNACIDSIHLDNTRLVKVIVNREELAKYHEFPEHIIGLADSGSCLVQEPHHCCS